MQRLTVDFIISLDGYGAADGWPGWWGLEGPEYLAWLGEQPEADFTVLMGATTYRLMYGFADADGIPNPAMPVTTVRMQLIERGGGTRMELRSSFDSREQMEQLMGMGMTEGLQQAVGQMDALLAE